MDCGNNPCDFAVDLRGQRTAGRCRCWDSLPKMDPETRAAVRRTAAELRAALATERAGREKDTKRLEALVKTLRRSSAYDGYWFAVNPIFEDIEDLIALADAAIEKESA